MGGRAGIPARALWLCVLLIHLSGCTSYRTVELPDAPSDPGDGSVWGEVRVGEGVRIVTDDGDRITGMVLRFTDEEVVINTADNWVVRERSVARASIVSIEKAQASTGLKIAGVVFGLAIFAATMFVIGVSQSGGIGR